MTAADLHTLTGAYAVQALTGAEREEFERHLADCPACAQEVRELTATAARLALAASVVPPPRMREAVLGRIAAVRQEPPLVPPAPEAGAEGAGAEGAGRAGRLARGLPRYALAACLAGAVALGGVAVWQHQAADQARQRADRVERQAAELSQVLAAPDAASATSRVGASTTATVVVSRDLGKAAFLATGMPRLSGGRTYELWFDDAGVMRAAGLMDPAVTDHAVVLAGRLDAASGVGVTVEPAGGSSHPTSHPLALLGFPDAGPAD